MAKKIIRLPGRMSRALLRLIGAAITFLFTFFVYASGQIVTATAMGKTAATSAQAKQSDTIFVTPAYGVPLYGIAPAYGVIILYGIPSAQFTVKGTIRSLDDKSAIGNARIVLKDTTTKLNADSAITAPDGSFSMTFWEGGIAMLNTWVLEVQDGDGAQNGSFQNKDTLISIPQDSLTGGTGLFEGADTVTIDLYLQKISASVTPPGPGASLARLSMRAWRAADGTIEMRYGLLAQEHTRMALYNANGRLVRELFDRHESAGEHEARMETSGLSAGIYFLKLQAGEHAAITRISIER